MKRPLAALAAGLAASVAVTVPSWGESDAAKQFKRSFTETQNSWERRDIVSRLDPSDEDSLNLLCDFVLKQQDWYMREAAIAVLAGAYDPGIITKLERLGGPRGDPMVSEGICMAFGQSHNKDRVPFLVEQLDSKKWVVKRAAAIALGQLRDKAGIEPLIKAWEGEDKFMVWVHILESLERITHQKDMKDAATWRGWWNAVKDTFVVPDEAEGGDEEANKSGERVQTRVRGTNIDVRTRGNGLPLLVLPDFAMEKDYLETYLRNLEETNQILYMTLPGSYDFRDPPLANAPGLPSPYYPIERIVDAFEELHAQLVKDGKIQDKPFAIMAHGLTCWIAMKYAEQHPDKVRKMILIAPHSGQKAQGEGRDRMEKQGAQTHDVELEHHAQSLLYDQQKGAFNYVAASEQEGTALSRKGWTVRFADVRDLEIGRIYGPEVVKQVGAEGQARVPKAIRPMGQVFVPEFSLFRLNKVPTATLVLVGELSVDTSLDDAEAIAKHYGAGGRVVSFKRSSTMPFIEENDKFVEIVQRFLGGGRGR